MAHYRIGACGVALLLALTTGPAWGDDWPQWLGPKRDGVWRETGLIERFPEKGPKVRWRVPVGGGYAGPAVAGGKVYVTDRVLAAGAKNPDNPFRKAAVEGKERVLCLEEATGKVLWTHEYDCKYDIAYPCGPRTTPVVAGGKVYTLGAMGDLFCLDADSGKVVWSKNFPRDYDARVAGWGFTSHPLLDGDRLICLVGGKGSTVVAFHKDTGKEIWKSLDTKTGIGYSPPMIFDVGGKRQLIAWTPEAVNALDPEKGVLLWSQPFFAKADLTAPTPRMSGNRLLVTSFYNGSMMLELDTEKPGAKVLWKGKGRGEKPEQTDGLHAIIATPVFKGDYIYGVCSYGELRCLEAATGKRVWMTLKATGNATKPEERWANAFLIEQGDRYWLFNEKGDLIIARLSPAGYEEISRAHILEPTGKLVGMREATVVWSHPAFANRSMYARNDKEIVCVSLAAGKGQ